MGPRVTLSPFNIKKRSRDLNKKLIKTVYNEKEKEKITTLECYTICTSYIFNDFKSNNTN